MMHVSAVGEEGEEGEEGGVGGGGLEATFVLACIHVCVNFTIMSFTTPPTPPPPPPLPPLPLSGSFLI